MQQIHLCRLIFYMAEKKIIVVIYFDLYLSIQLYNYDTAQDLNVVTNICSPSLNHNLRNAQYTTINQNKF